MSRFRRIAAAPWRRATAILIVTMGLAACLGLLLDRLFPFPVERLEAPAATRVLDRAGLTHALCFTAALRPDQMIPANSWMLALRRPNNLS